MASLAASAGLRGVGEGGEPTGSATGGAAVCQGGAGALQRGRRHLRHAARASGPPLASPRAAPPKQPRRCCGTAARDAKRRDAKRREAKRSEAKRSHLPLSLAGPPLRALARTFAAWLHDSFEALAWFWSRSPQYPRQTGCPLHPSSVEFGP